MAGKIGKSSSFANWIGLASVMISASASSGALAQSDMRPFVNERAALAQAAIAKCDYDEYVSLKAAYDNFAPAAGRFKIQPFPPYPFPCISQSAPVTVTRIGRASTPTMPDPFVAYRVSQAWAWSPYVSVLGGGTAGSTRFDVTPSFSPPGTGGFFEADVGLRTGVPQTNYTFGARFAAIWGPYGKAEFYPPSGFDYSVRHPVTGVAEITVGTQGIMFGDTGLQRVTENNRLAFEGSLGVAIGLREVLARMPGFEVKDTTTDFGLTGSLRVEVPINNYLRALGQVRYIHTFPGTVNIPGAVNIQSDIWYIGAGVSIDLTPPPSQNDGRYPVM